MAYTARLKRTDYFDFREWFLRNYEWSTATFGPSRGATGPLDHLKKEIKELEDDPLDLEEWIDAAFLVCDGFRRAYMQKYPGASPMEVFRHFMYVANAKQDKNFLRDWPPISEQKEGVAVEHVRGKHD